MNSNNLAVLILAAGSSSRLGQPKQLLQHKGTTLLEHTIECALAVSDNISVVLGGNVEKIKSQIDFESIQCNYNPNWKQGIGNSLAFGIQSLSEQQPNIQSILVLLSDQPMISKKLLTTLCELQVGSGKPITACNYVDTYGVPAIFHKSIFNKLINLQTDKGAKSVISEHKKLTSFLNFPGGKIDIDDPEDLKYLESS